ncbi:MAG: YkgJ family cysteine cluster protein, partial [Muriicola sp.]
MKEVLQQLPQKAAEKQAENKKFFARLKKRPPKDLDYT